MRGEYFSYGLLAALAIALLYAAITDIRHRRIDNWLNAAIALTAPLFWWATDLPLWPGLAWQLGSALICFALCCLLVALRQMGGGDLKLLTALALWIEPIWFLRLFVVMALIGGVLTLFFAARHFARRQKDKPAIPYGIAIACAGLWTLANQYLPAIKAGGQLG